MKVSFCYAQNKKGEMLMIDIGLLFQDEIVKNMPIIDVLNVVSAIQKQEDSTRTVIDNNIIKEEMVNHG